MTTTSDTINIKLGISMLELNNIFDTNFKTADEIVEYIKSSLGYLHSHNKNLTNQQYWLIDELYSAFKKAESA